MTLCHELSITFMEIFVKRWSKMNKIFVFIKLRISCDHDTIV